MITLQDAIRKMTSWPATRLRIPVRGLIKEGMWADVVIFDYDKIQVNATSEYPFRTPTGIDFVMVNGQIVIEKGKHTGAKPGKVMYGPGRSSQ
jgi:N-acyl-D-aspartate/D-glutamate deacylase